MKRAIITGAVVVGVLVVGVLIYGYLTEVVFKAQEPVATVNEVPISTADFQARVRYERTLRNIELLNLRQQQMSLDPTESAALLDQLTRQIRTLEGELGPENATEVGRQVLGDMVREEIVRQEADRHGITVTPEEVDRGIEEWLGYDRDAATEDSETPFTGPVTNTDVITPTGFVSFEEFQERYNNFRESVLGPSQLGEEGFRELIRVSLLYEQVYELIVEDIAEVMEQIQVNYIAFESEEEATAMVARLEAGEVWQDVVAEITESDVQAFAGESGWQTAMMFTEQFGAEISRAVFATAVGEYTGPFLGLGGWYYLFQVTGHEERELDANTLAYEQNRVFQEWLDQQSQFVEYSDDWEDRVPTEP